VPDIDNLPGIWRIEVMAPCCAVPLIERLFENNVLSISIFTNQISSQTERIISILTKHRPNLHTLKRQLLDISSAAELEPFTTRLDWLPSENWVHRSLTFHQPVRINRLLIHGTHDTARGAPIRLCIDAGEAFGTGRHDSTRGCLEAIQQLALKRTFLHPLDVGTGTGILAMTMAHLFQRQVIATDNDPKSVKIARQNIAMNGLSRTVQVLLANGASESVVLRKGPYDLIVMNLLFRPIFSMAPVIINRLTHGGNLILSGLLHSQARTLIARYVSLGCRLEYRTAYSEWETLIFRR
tara:strand:+ start:538 stop:1425 length:888 start_codon:yes stop_codon:yes gene_type:complete